MKFSKKFKAKVVKFIKVAGLVLASIFIVSLVLNILASVFSGMSFDTTSEVPSYGIEESAYTSSGQTLSRYSSGSKTTGDDAEEFEVTEYNISFKTNHLYDMRDKVSALKSRDDVIFESAEEYEKSGYYVFKVKNDSASEILAIIEELNPTTVNQNIYTIKSLIDSYTNKVDILENKLSTIEEALSDAISAYDDIAEIAITAQDVENLTKIIDSKVELIKNLSQERIDISGKIDEIEISRAVQLDRLNYTYFNINVIEDKLINIQDLKDSWKIAAKSFISDANGVIQGITINLIAFLFIILQFAVYWFVILIGVKYGWRLTKHIWKK